MIRNSLTTQYTERAVEFIEKNRDNPFFLYVPHSDGVHVLLFVSDKFKGKSGAGLFGDVMMEVDWSVGQILETLRKHKLDKDTLVVFTSDNGLVQLRRLRRFLRPACARARPMFDGGCRSTLMWWPGIIPAGRASAALRR